MAIVIQSIPSNQVLNETAGDESYLSMFVTGLDQLGTVTAKLGGSNAVDFVNPPEVFSVKPSNGQYTVILQLTGTVEPTEDCRREIIPGQGEYDSVEPADPELTVTIIQGPMSSNPTMVIAIYINPNDN